MSETDGEISRGEIARGPYELSQLENPGTDEENWLQAEPALREGRSTAPARPKRKRTVRVTQD